MSSKVPWSVLRTALKEARKSNCSDYKHSAIIYASGGRIISKACNLAFKTHPRGSGCYSTCHAEVGAIMRGLRVRHNLRDCKIFVLRTNKFGDIKNSRPCPDCAKLINSVGLKASWSE